MEEKSKLTIEEIDRLTQEFITFQQTTQKLMLAYENLQKRFETVNIELAEKNKKLEESLIQIDEMRNYSASILQSITSGVIAINLDGVVTTFNKAAENILRYNTKDVIGNKYSEIIKYNEKINLLNVLDTRESIYFHEIELERADNEKFIAEFSASPVFDSDNKLLGAVAVYRDLSEIKKLEKVIQQKETLVALGEMAANVAHEIRNPLGGIEGFATLLKRRISNDEKSLDLVNKIIEGVKNLNNIVSSLLFYTKPIKLNYFKTNIRLIIDTAILLLSSDKNFTKKIYFNKIYDNSDLFVYGDMEQLKQVFINIIKNSIEAIDKEEGEIKIELKSDKNNIVISISDNGIGMTENQMKNIFTPFFTTKKDGTGLGLAICQKIIEAHFGNIKVTSEANVGTCFTITLPIKKD